MTDSTERLAALIEAARAGGPEADFAALAAEHGVDPEEAADALAALRALEGNDTPRELPRPELPERFELMDELGRGGMGVVYRARQKGLERDVAVKVLVPGELVFGEALARFQREARVLAKLRHPHIVPIHEVGEASGSVYYAMDLFEGGSLADLLAKKRRPMPVARVVKLMRQVTEAVAFVHGHGLVHRDLKPANVLLDEAGDAYVADFGLAVDPSEGATLTATGRLLGTPDYMAPEQARGERARITERTDVYALGVMLYECLTGRRPFKGRGLVDKIHAVVHEEPPAPRKVNPDVPVELERVVLQAMAKEPGERYATASALAEDLARFEAGRPVEAKGVSGWVSARRTLERHRTAVIAAAVGALLAGAALYLGVSFERSSEERLADAQRLAAAGERRAAELLYLDALEDLRGSKSLERAELELAIEGVAAAIGEARRAGTDSNEEAAQQLRSDVDWVRALLDEEDPRRWLIGVAAARTPADEARELDALQTWVTQRLNELQAQGEDPVVPIVVAPFERYLRDPGHPLLAGAGAGLLPLLKWTYRWGVVDPTIPWRHALVAAVGLTEEAGFEETDLPASAAWMVRLLGDDLGSGAFEEELLQAIEDPSLADEGREALVQTMTTLLRLPSPRINIYERNDTGSNRLVGTYLPEHSIEDLAATLRSTRGSKHSVRQQELAEYAARLIDGHEHVGRVDTFRQQGWLHARTGIEVRGRVDERNVLEFVRGKIANGVEDALLERLGGRDLSSREWVDRFVATDNEMERRWIQERLRYLSPDSARTPPWIGVPPYNDGPPSDHIGRWREHFGLEVRVPSRVDVGLVAVPVDGGVPSLLDHGVVVLIRGESVSVDLDAAFPDSLVSLENLSLGDLNLREARSPRFGSAPVDPTSSGTVSISLEATPVDDVDGPVAHFKVRGAYRLAGAARTLPAPITQLGESVPRGAVRAVAEIGFNGSQASGRAVTSLRVFVLVRVGDEEEPLDSLDGWYGALFGEHVRITCDPDSDEDRAIRDYWGSLTPAVLTCMARLDPSGARIEELRERLSDTRSGNRRGAYSGGGTFGYRAYELALGKVAGSAVSRDIAQILDRMPDFAFSDEWGALESQLLQDPRADLRQSAGRHSRGQALLDAELISIAAVWAKAGDDLPPRIERKLGNVRVDRGHQSLRMHQLVWAAGALVVAAISLFRLQFAGSLLSAVVLFVILGAAAAFAEPRASHPQVGWVLLAVAGAGFRARGVPWFALALLATELCRIFAFGSAEFDLWNAAARMFVVLASASLVAQPPFGGPRRPWALLAGIVALAYLPSVVALLLRATERPGLFDEALAVLDRWPIDILAVVAAVAALTALDRSVRPLWTWRNERRRRIRSAG